MAIEHLNNGTHRVESLTDQFVPLQAVIGTIQRSPILLRHQQEQLLTNIVALGLSFPEDVVAGRVEEEVETRIDEEIEAHQRRLEIWYEKKVKISVEAQLSEEREKLRKFEEDHPDLPMEAVDLALRALFGKGFEDLHLLERRKVEDALQQLYTALNEGLPTENSFEIDFPKVLDFTFPPEIETKPSDPTENKEKKSLEDLPF